MANNGIFIIRDKQPKKVGDMKRASVACFIASVLGDNSGVGSYGGSWEVFWTTDGVTENGYGNTGEGLGIVWLSEHGVYIGNGVDVSKFYQIIGYCAFQNIPYFTADSLLKMA